MDLILFIEKDCDQHNVFKTIAFFLILKILKADRLMVSETKIKVNVVCKLERICSFGLSKLDLHKSCVKLIRCFLHSAWCNELEKIKINITLLKISVTEILNH